MALPWYAHKIAKYERKTAHLSMLQHGAYRLLLDHYYRTAAPLPAKLEQVHRICRAVAEEEQQAVSAVLNEFFVLKQGGWHNETADEELEKMAELSKKRSQAAGDRWGENAKKTRRQRVSAAKDAATHSDAEWAALLAITGYKCLKCGASGADAELTKDHIIPLCKGGTDAISNLQPLCARCNSARGSEPEDYRAAAFRNDAIASEEGSNRNASAQHLHHTLNTQPIPITKQENISSFVVGRGGKRAGKSDGVTIEDPDERIARFQKSIAQELGRDGWTIVAAAADPQNPNYDQALAACQASAKRLGKGWPHRWPAPQQARSA